LRAHSSQAYHTSYPVPVRRPAPSLHASFRPHLTVTPLRCACPSAPRLPGQGTLTPEQYDMHGTHAQAHLPGPTLRPRSGAASGCVRTDHLLPRIDTVEGKPAFLLRMEVGKTPWLRPLLQSSVARPEGSARASYDRQAQAGSFPPALSATSASRSTRCSWLASWCQRDAHRVVVGASASGDCP
jgi:hypothetical protein